jgi:DNA-binding Xre family transcriptional regulator
MSTYRIWDPKEERRKSSQLPGYEERAAEAADNEMVHGLAFWFNIYRKRRKITQKMISDDLRISQSAVCQMLKRPVTVGTLWRLCRAMNAELQINIRFEGEEWKSLIYGDDPLSPEDQAMVDAHNAEAQVAK